MPYQLSRPRTVVDLIARLENFSTPEGWQNGMDYKPDPTDVFIVTPPKCGTTWTQQIVHGLRTRGSMDFDEISRVIPWIHMAHDCGIDIHAPQPARPHAFKTHMPLDENPKGGKYIVVLRNPSDALVSHYYFFEGFFFEKGSIDLEAFAREYFIPRQSVFTHIESMWGRRNDSDVLPLFYENMKADLAGTVKRVAEFIDITLDDELLEIVIRQSDIQFMQAHENQFEDHIIRKARSAAMGLPEDGQLSKVRDGQVGASKQRVSDAIKKELDDIWESKIAPLTGFNTYEEMRRELGTG